MKKAARATRSPQFVIRKAKPQDKKSVLAFTKDTFGEHSDYIAYVWDRWLKDKDGYFWVAEYRGRAVGIAKLTFHSPDEAWMEGLRVNPRQRGKGIARALHQVCVEAAEDRKVGVVRLATNSENTAVHHMCAEFGMGKTSSFAYYYAPPLPSDARQPLTLAPELFSVAWDSVSKSSFLEASKGLYARQAIRWFWKEMTVERLKEHLQKGEALAYIGPGGAIDALAILGKIHGGKGRWISFLDGKPAAVQEIALALRRTEVEGMFPEPHPIISLLEESGYEQGFEPQMWIFEKRFAPKRRSNA